tara:strand:+ start:2147 stop:4489 length:2343 start_codon:yes stop_codon:yes gene_type:complete
MHEHKSGTQLANRYTLVRKLGAGGGAEVWLADDRMTGAHVALKLLVDPSISNDVLRREWQLSIRLMHAHIVRVFEFHEATDSGGPAFFSLQFIDGPSVDVLGKATTAEILAPMALIADALRYAHAKGIVHRDIKASNVLLDAHGAPYLIDFGVAANGTDAVRGGSLIAASPQSLAGEAPQPADDIFALGGMLYELLAGHSPYSADNTADDIRYRVPPPVSRVDGDTVPENIAELIAAMLHKDTKDRPDAAAVYDAILAAGISPGAAPASYVHKPEHTHDQVISSSISATRKRPAVAAAVETPLAGGSGLTPRTVGIALGVLLLLLLAVIFVLPRTMTAPPDNAAVQSAGEEEAQATAPASASTEVLPERDERVQDRAATEEVLGPLLAKIRTLEGRAVARWGGLAWQKTQQAYEAGDAAYLARDYAAATAHYLEATELIEPLLGRVDNLFETTLADASAALENGDVLEALRLYELAVAMTPGHAGAQAGLLRAQNLDEVLALTDAGLRLEQQLELDAARDNFARAVEIDPQWKVAQDGLERVNAKINQNSFDARMTEGLNALAANDYLAARAAFRMAQALQPGSAEPADGLLQVEQALRLNNIRALEKEAADLEATEQWKAAEASYKRILELDADLAFAKNGLQRSQQMIALHAQLDEYIAAPDSLSQERTMQKATDLVVNITRMGDIGPRLAAARDDLARLLKRAATPLTVQLVSDQATDVSIYRVARLGSFAETELTLRPGTYVAVGSRPGYRDVRIEFRVAPELDMQPVVIRCEEKI